MIECRICKVEHELTEYYYADKDKKRIDRRCKSCLRARGRTALHKERVRKWRAKKTSEGYFGRCKKCDGALGRNEHPGRSKPPAGICAKCLTLESHHNWKGGKTLNTDGYVVIRYAPRKQMLEHRYVMEQHLGRPLNADETVHHINGKRDDNRLENLELWVGAPTRGIRKEDAIAWAREILERYGV